MTRKWSNYPTYCVHQWIINEESLFEYCLDAANKIRLDHKRPRKLLKHFLQGYVTGAVPSLDGFWHKLLTHSLEEVNWGEMADYLLDGLQAYDDLMDMEEKRKTDVTEEKDDD